MYRTVGNLLFYRSFDLGERIRTSVPRGLIVSFKLATFHFSHISCRWCIFTLDIYSRWNERGRRKSRDRIRIRPNFSPFVARFVEFLHFFFSFLRTCLSATRITTHFRLRSRKFLTWPISIRNLFVYVFFFTRRRWKRGYARPIRRRKRETKKRPMVCDYLGQVISSVGMVAVVESSWILLANVINANQKLVPISFFFRTSFQGKLLSLLFPLVSCSPPTESKSRCRFLKYVGTRGESFLTSLFHRSTGSIFCFQLAIILEVKKLDDRWFSRRWKICGLYRSASNRIWKF